MSELVLDDGAPLLIQTLAVTSATLPRRTDTGTVVFSTGVLVMRISWLLSERVPLNSISVHVITALFAI